MVKVIHVAQTCCMYDYSIMYKRFTCGSIHLGNFYVSWMENIIKKYLPHDGPHPSSTTNKCYRSLKLLSQMPIRVVLFQLLILDKACECTLGITCMDSLQNKARCEF